MCFSAQVWQSYMDYQRKLAVTLSIDEFVELYAARARGEKIKTAKAMDDAFLAAGTADAAPIAGFIRDWNAQQASELETLLFAQRIRLADAQRALLSKTTKKALADERIATGKIAWAKAKLADLRRSTPEDRDSRIYPGVHAPVLLVENGQRVLKPMRYQCRPAGRPASYDSRYPGTYNARRDNLEGFWRGQFGHSHGVIACQAFYEIVSRHQAEGRELAVGEAEQNTVLEFRPQSGQLMLLACLVSHWQRGDESLWSFAAITDEPPAEVAAAGHDRCVIPLKPEHLDAWLNPDPRDLGALHAILDDRERPHYEHRMAA